MKRSDEEKTEGLCEHIRVTSTWEDKQMVTEKPEHKHTHIFVNSTSQANRRKPTQPGQFLLTQAPQRVCHCTRSIGTALAAAPRWESWDRMLRNITNTCSPQAPLPTNAGDGGQAAGTGELPLALAVLMLLGTQHFLKGLEFKSYDLREHHSRSRRHVADHERKAVP